MHQTINITVDEDTADLVNSERLYALHPRARLAVLEKAHELLAEEIQHAKASAYLALASQPQPVRRRR